MYIEKNVLVTPDVAFSVNSYNHCLTNKATPAKGVYSHSDYLMFQWREGGRERKREGERKRERERERDKPHVLLSTL